jgi:MerR family transcriptional regulator, redox-sensitive transcriptional activator SoxR
MPSARQISIGEVARRAGLRVSAIRYYEREGLIHPPRRQSGKRVYGAEVFETLALIRLAQEAGFTIRDTRQLLEGFEVSTPASVRWQLLAQRKLEETQRLITEAERMRALLLRLLQCRCTTLASCVRSRTAQMVTEVA